MDTDSEISYARHLTAMGHGTLTPTMVAGLDAWYTTILPAVKSTHILDYSCGCGDFLRYLAFRGYTNLVGCDRNRELVQVASANTRLVIQHVQNLGEFSADHNEKFDWINMKDVIEHIEKANVIPDLIQLRKMLKPRGILVISCPQMAGFTSLYTLYNDFTHQTLYTESSLIYILQAAGFSRWRFIVPREPVSRKPTTLLFRTARILWFRLVQMIYLLERPGEQMPKIKGDRMVVAADK